MTRILWLAENGKTRVLFHFTTQTHQILLSILLVVRLEMPPVWFDRQKAKLNLN